MRIRMRLAASSSNPNSFVIMKEVIFDNGYFQTKVALLEKHYNYQPIAHDALTIDYGIDNYGG